jgi:hypothetical protein
MDNKDKVIYLLREYQPLCEGGFCPNLLTEDEKHLMKDNGDVFLTGIMQTGGVLNGNGRIYNKKILEREFNNYQKFIEGRRATGELDHPESSVVNLKNASHMVIKQWWDGDNWMGKIKLLNTPSGLIAKTLVSDGVQLGISSRALGSVTEEKGTGRTLVNDDLTMLCFDLVSEPSTPNAFMLKEATYKEVKLFMEKKESPYLVGDKIFKINEILDRIIF